MPVLDESETMTAAAGRLRVHASYVHLRVASLILVLWSLSNMFVKSKLSWSVRMIWLKRRCRPWGRVILMKCRRMMFGSWLIFDFGLFADYVQFTFIWLLGFYTAGELTIRYSIISFWRCLCTRIFIMSFADTSFFLNIYHWFLFRRCGSRTTGEVLIPSFLISVVNAT